MKEQIKQDFKKLITNSNFSKKNIEFKKENFNRFVENGFPNKREESWKFSDLSQIISKNIKNLTFYNDLSKSNQVDESIFIDKLEHNKLVFVNGRIEKIDFKYEEKDKIEINEDYNLFNEKNIANSLLSLNKAFLNKCFKLTVKKNYNFNKPLIIYNITNNQLESTNLSLRIDIELQENSFLKLINFFNDSSNNNFINVNYQFNIKENSVLKNYKIDKKLNSNIKYFYTNIDQELNSIAEVFIMSSGSKFLRNEINCNLNGEYSSSFVNGIINLNGSQHHEIKANLNHFAENTKSYQLVKSVLKDEAKSVFQGKIYVNEKAQKTDAYQLSKTILLNDNTEFNAKPELEIYADDVKCSHGSASGNLDENSIFYLMSRGLSFEDAKNLLISGFLLDVIDKITDIEIKTLIKKIIGFKEWT